MVDWLTSLSQDFGDALPKVVMLRRSKVKIGDPEESYLLAERVSLHFMLFGVVAQLVMI